MRPRTLAIIFWLLAMTVSAHAQAEQWVPHTIPPQQLTELRVWTSGDRTHARVLVTFPDLGYRITDWGTVERQGRSLSIDIKAERWTGGSGQAIQVLEQFYDLGTLPSETGTFTFTVKSRGALVKSVEFDPRQIVEHWEETSLEQNQVLHVINTTGGVTFAQPCLNFPDTGYRVIEWRDPVRSGNDFSTAVKLERFTGRVEKSRTAFQACRVFILGVNLPPNETLTFTVRFSNGVAHTSRPFTPTGQSGGGNPIEHPAYFVRQNYLDFLGREPDTNGLNFWYNEITNMCGGFFPECIERRRTNTSAAFYLSIEFQQTGYLVYRLHKAAFGTTVRFEQFLPDTRAVGQGVVVGAAGWEALLEANKQSFVEAFVARTEFRERYADTLTPEQYIDALNRNTAHVWSELEGGVLSPSEREQLANGLRNGTETRASVLRKVAEDAEFSRQEFNRAFVLMQYFGYLRRSPDVAPDSNWDGFNFWLAKLNQFRGDFHAAEMVRAFLVSQEYLRRFNQN